MNEILIFLALQLVNVILSTLKSILTIKGNKWSAVLLNGIYYGYYTFIIKAIGDTKSFNVFGIELNGVVVMAVITILTNFIGVYISLTIMEKLRKDKLWLMKITVKKDEAADLISEFSKNGMSFIVLESNWEKIKPIDVYLYNKDETKICKDILRKFSSIKYCIIEADTPIKL